jgi:hypothetical protein
MTVFGYPGDTVETLGNETAEVSAVSNESYIEIETYSTASLVDTATESEIVEVVDRGPAGAPGVQIVDNANDPNYPRPNAPVVYWIGTAVPNNAQSWDWWKGNS